eukprot:5358189-Prymnesium_polylepis.1
MATKSSPCGRCVGLTRGETARQSSAECGFIKSVLRGAVGLEARCVNGSFNIRTRQGGCEQVEHGARTDATM